MKISKAFISLAIACLISACGGGGSSDNDDSKTSSNTTVPPGIYSGSVTDQYDISDPAIAMIASNGTAVLFDGGTGEVFIGDASGNTISGTLFSTTTVPMTATVETVTGDSIEGSFENALNHGSFALVNDTNLYNRGASLEKLEGVWVDDFFTSEIGTTTWTIMANGQFTMSSTSGCSASGQFSTIDPGKNEYALTATVANCLDYEGSYQGIAVLSDTYFTNDTISMGFRNGSRGGLFEPVKQ